MNSSLRLANCSSLTRRAVWIPHKRRLLPVASLLRRQRPYSDYSPARYVPKPPASVEEGSVQSEFREGFSNVASFYSRVIKITSIGLISTFALVYGGYEAAHQWIERVELSSQPASDDDPYGWGEDSLERWSHASDGGGTDPKLGYRGRHAVRATWMTLNWSSDPNASNVINTTTPSNSGENNPFNKQLHSALSYISVALKIARTNASKPAPSSLPSHPVSSDDNAPINDPTVASLSTLNAIILTRIASPETLALAKPIYRQIIEYHIEQRQPIQAAQLCTKLGDVCAILKEGDEAVEWWSRSLEFLGLDVSNRVPEPSPVALRASPLQQRAIVSSIVPLSAYYASKRQHKEAARIQHLGFQLIRTFIDSEDLSLGSSSSPAKSLHIAALIHRAALLRIHASEVTYSRRQLQKPDAQKAMPKNEKGWFSRKSAPASSESSSSDEEILGLKSAAQASEDVFGLLTSGSSNENLWIVDALRVLPPSIDSLPPSGATSPSTASAAGLPDPKASPLPQFASSPTLLRPAKAYLRQAKRSAAESLKLTGILLELSTSPTSVPAFTKNLPSDQKDVSIISDRDVEALECYERALAWLGGGPDGRAGEDVTEKEWMDVWTRYARMRAKIVGEEA